MRKRRAQLSFALLLAAFSAFAPIASLGALFAYDAQLLAAAECTGFGEAQPTRDGTSLVASRRINGPDGTRLPPTTFSGGDCPVVRRALLMLQPGSAEHAFTRHLIIPHSIHAPPGAVEMHSKKYSESWLI